jgi:hypothetical protein
MTVGQVLCPNYGIQIGDGLRISAVYRDLRHLRHLELLHCRRPLRRLDDLGPS